MPRSMAIVLGAFGAAVWVCGGFGTAQKPQTELSKDYSTTVRPLVQKYCLGCHSTKLKKGSLDLERFATADDVRNDLKVWQHTIELLEAGEMPPANRPQPTVDERKKLIDWARTFLDAEARARAGDPGHVPLRRLSNAEYDSTIRDLCGVDLRPTREFPADGAAGEGFTNAAEALTDISPALLTKYLNAAKDISDRAVLLPDGFRFSPSKTRRDWTDESTARLRQFYSQYTPDGRLPVQPYLAATVRHREQLLAGTITLDEVARIEKLNRKYLGVLWQVLTDRSPSHPLDLIRVKWRQAMEKDVPALAAEVAAWQAVLWRFVPIGSYRHGDSDRQVPNDPPAVASQTLKLAFKPVPGQSDVVLHLAARDLVPGNQDGTVTWVRPRLEAAGKPPLLLRDYAQFGPTHEFDYATVFADTGKYLAAVRELAVDPKQTVDDVAQKHGLNPAFLKRWVDVVALKPATDPPTDVLRTIPAAPLTRLDEKLQNDKWPAIKGWRKKGTDLPAVMTNSSDATLQIPGTARGHTVVVHPLPQEFVGVVWTSPVEASVRVTVTIAHAHPACGNGVAWRLEHRRGEQAGVLAEGAVDLGKSISPPARTAKVQKGDALLLVIDARDANHVCDLTEVSLSITEVEPPARTWNLAADVADSVLEGNPHADTHGHKDTWSFVRGPSTPGAAAGSGPTIPPDSLLGRWRNAKPDEAAKLAVDVQTLLTGSRPVAEKHPDRILFDNLVIADGPLLQGLDLAKLGQPRVARHYGLPRAEESLSVPANSVTEVRLPAALFRDREFVVEARADGGDRVVQVQLTTAAPGPIPRWDGKSPVVASPTGTAYPQLIRGHAEFRACFPQFLCFPQVIPTDEVVSLKMFHREDGPLIRLFLDDEQTRRINHLWTEHRFISRQPIAENDYLPQFIGYVTQDQPKQLLAYYESQRPVFQKRADEFEKDLNAAIPRQLETLLEFASRAYRRPLAEKEKAELLALYRTLRENGAPHEEAFRGVIARVLVSPAFLFRIEHAPPGKVAGPVSDWELATRLSYFLWASLPDDELRSLAAAGKLHNPAVLAEQTRRMVKDDRVRRLAIEFGTQWIHVRGFDEFNEKNEKLFPTFTPELRRAMNQEGILFFQDLFQSDRALSQILDADYAFLNEQLAKHYAIPGVSGPQWRRVDGVKKHGRGGILGFGSVQAKQAGASRTSPVLRGNWVVETLLGEKLPRPPANVPQLPQEEGVDKLTVRQQVERHAKAPECAVCHVRIDPYGFALEKYDAIGRRREHDLAGLAIDSRATLKDGTQFNDLDGLRNYLLTKKKDVFVRLFCRKLLGYALGRSVTLSDTALLDEMVAELNKNDGRVSAALQAIVGSPQFRMRRGRE